MAELGYVNFMLNSGVRQSILRCLRERELSRREIQGMIDVSKSAVYKEVSALEERRFLERSGGELRLTGIGILMIECLSKLEGLESLVESNPKYWSSRDLSVLPNPFGSRLHELSGAKVVEADSIEVLDLINRVCDKVRKSGRSWIVFPAYLDRYRKSLEDAVERGCSARIVLSPEAMEKVPHGSLTQRSSLEVRVLDVDFALGIIDNSILLYLPEHGQGGTYDPGAKIFSDSHSAMRWGEELFRRCWSEAQPV